MATVAELNARIGADISGLDKGLNKAEKSIAGFAKKAERAGKTASKFITLPLLAAGGAAIKLASDAEETQSKFDAVFGSMAESTNEWAEDFGAAVGRSRTDVKAWLATIQDTFVPLGFARDEAAGFAKELATLAVDVASFNNAADKDVLRDFQSALVGNTETVRKYGIVITEANTKAEAYSSGIAEVGSELTAQQKVQARLNLIMNGTTDAQGDAIRTAGSFANQSKALSADLKNLGEDMGKILLPVAKDVVSIIRDATAVFADMSPEAQKTVIAVAAFAAAAGPAVFITSKLITAVVAAKVALAGMTAATKADTIATKTNTLSKAKNIAAFGALSAVAVVAADDLINMATTMEEENERAERIIESHGIMANTFDSWGRSLLGSDRKLFGLSVGLEKYDKKAKTGTDRTLDWRGAIDKATGATDDLADELDDDLTPAMDETARAIAALSGLTSEYFNEAEQAAAVSRDLADAQREVDEQTIENKKLLEEYNEVVSEFGKGSDEATLALGRLKDGEDSLADANNILTEKQGDVNKALENTAREAGLTKDGFNKLIEETENWDDLTVAEKEVKINVVGAKNLAEANRQIRIFNQSGSFRFDGKVVAPPVSGNAHGGFIPPGQTRVVGENGPEIVNFPSGGRVTNNQRMRSGDLSSAGIDEGNGGNIIVNLFANDMEEAERLMERVINKNTRQGVLSRRAI